MIINWYAPVSLTVHNMGEVVPLDKSMIVGIGRAAYVEMAHDLAGFWWVTQVRVTRQDSLHLLIVNVIFVKIFVASLHCLPINIYNV